MDAFASITDLRKGLREKKFSSQELATELHKKASQGDAKIKSILRLENLETLQRKAKQWDSGADKEKPLGGIPFVLKDMVSVKGRPLTAGSKILKNYIAPYEATLAEKLHAAGGIFFGHANQDEFAMGSTNETSAYGVCLNPVSPAHVAGGSSGGSAACVAAGFVPGSVGTDTGGSIRLPASFCGIVGAKPTYGRISRYGVIAYASSFDQAGPLTRTVQDCALMMEVMSGYDIMDATSAKKQVPSWSQSLAPQLKNKKVAVLKGWQDLPLEKSIKEHLKQAVQHFEKTGHQIIEVDLPHAEHSVSVYYVLATSEASSNLSRYDGVRYGKRAEGAMDNWSELYMKTRGEGFGYEVKKRIMLGTFALSQGFYDAWFLKAARLRRLIQQDVLKALQSADILLLPVATSTAPKVGETLKDPLKMYFNDRFTTLANLAGCPALSVPVGADSNGMPIGLQIIARPWDEQAMFDGAHSLEKHFAWKNPLAGRSS